MRKINFKNIIVLILMLGAAIGVISDAIHLINGETYTWLGLVTTVINLIILGEGWDYLEL